MSTRPASTPRRRGRPIALAAFGLALTLPAAGPSASRAAADHSLTSPAAADDVTVNEFLSYDAAKQNVALALIAGYNATLGGFNFNGGTAGKQTITIPVGWTVHVAFTNKGVLPHSAVVVKDQKPIPMAPDTPDIPHAATTRPVEGIDPGSDTDAFTFTAARPGSYLIACGVPGHAPTGMWIRLVISADAKTPAYGM